MFKVIEDYDEAAALGKCGLLWFRVANSGDDWQPSVRNPDRWGSRDCVGREAVAAGKYAILLED